MELIYPVTAFANAVILTRKLNLVSSNFDMMSTSLYYQLHNIITSKWKKFPFVTICGNNSRKQVSPVLQLVTFTCDKYFLTGQLLNNEVNLFVCRIQPKKRIPQGATG